MTGSIATRQYARPGLHDAILAALVAAGKDPDRLGVADLAPVDAFHIRGRQATVELAARAAIDAATHVLDVGCGLGGSARHLVATHGCRVTGIDFTFDYVDVAARLAQRVGLADRTDFACASATALPFADATFDVAWTEHVQMNVADKRAFYGEIARVLRPGGTFLCHDVFAGAGGAPHHPVPWADDPRSSWLADADAARAAMTASGLAVAHWEDVTAKSLAWFEALAARGSPGASPLGMHLVMGATTGAKFANNVRNLREGRIVVVQAVARRG